MSDELTNRNGGLTSASTDSSVAMMIDALCDEFESAWRSETPVSIERQLEKISPAHHSALLRELLELEIELRTADHQVFSAQEYISRFPANTELAELVFRRVIRRKQIGDYELLDEIGHGGMGVVYRARQVFLNQTVAIKILPERFLGDSLVVSRFRREMQMIGGLDHPNIVRALNAGESQGTLYLVMEFVEGINLSQLIRSNTKNGTALSCGAAAEIVRQAALGLQHAYEHGLVHRDIKPANVMITRSGTVKILDLGLGKFRDDNRFEEEREPTLTKFGSTMGTIDYMAPEQWENATTADIRADIYSLGSTLFYLLVGRAPFEGSEYSSQRKKLLAHIEEDVPPISRFRSDCPKGMEAVLAKMVAKEPKDRFQTPDELLRAIAPFPRFSDLYSAVVDVGDIRPSDTSSTPPVRSVEEDTHGNITRRRHLAVSNAHSSQERESYWLSLPQAKGANRNHKNNASWGSLSKILAVLFLAVFCGILLFQRTRRSGEPGDIPAGNEARPIAKNADPRVQRITEDLAELPGLGGQWWFSEMPWYLPFVREDIANAIRSGQIDLARLTDPPSSGNEKKGIPGTNTLPYLNPNIVRAQEFLWNLVLGRLERMPKHRAELVKELQKTFDARIDRDQLASILERLLSQFEKETLNLTAVDYHTIALLQHQLAAMRSDNTLSERAQESYRKAIGLYSDENPTDRLLKPVCRSDAARLGFWANGDIASFERTAYDILRSDNLSDLFRIEFLATFGDICMSAGKNNDRLFDEANKILANSEIGPLVHPLAGHIRERHAWSLIDQCRFEEAALQFVEALRIRENNRDQSHNPFAAIYVYHNLHGLALTRRYLGDIDGARKSFAFVIEKVKEALSQETLKEPAQLRYFDSLQERLYNSLERFGDCALYGGAASFGTSGARVSVSDLKQAAELYEQARSTIDNRSLRLVLSCKLAIIKAVLGETEEAKAILAEWDNIGTFALGTERRRGTLIRQVADAVVLLKGNEKAGNGPGITQGQGDLRRFLMQFGQDTTDGFRFRRETLELQFFSAEVLISSERESGDLESARHDLTCLDPLLASIAPIPATRPFLYPYYSLAIRCYNEPTAPVAGGETVSATNLPTANLPEGSNADSSESTGRQRLNLSQLRYIRQSRLWKESKEDRERGTVFFYFSSRSGIAIYMPKDNRPTERFVIPYSRQQIKEAGSANQQLQLPQRLAGLIEQDKPTISFNDEVCWHRKSDALSDGDWPFEKVDLKPTE